MSAGVCGFHGLPGVYMQVEYYASDFIAANVPDVILATGDSVKVKPSALISIMAFVTFVFKCIE